MTRPERLCVALTLALSAGLATGCGSSTKATTGTTRAKSTSTSATVPTTVASPTTTAHKDPCTYVTKTEVASATAKTVTATRAANDFVCDYLTSDSGVVNIGVVSGTTRAIVLQQLENATTITTVPPTVPGVGDVAWATNGGVEVVRGSAAINVTVFGNGSYAAPGNAGAVAIARLILGRI
jgi:hypothetical protein